MSSTTASAPPVSMTAGAPPPEATDVCRVVSKTALFAADFTSSWLSYVSSLLLSHPLDTLRIRWQTRGQHPLTSLRRDGARSLYAGMLTPIMCNGPIIGILFALNEFYRVLARSCNTHVLHHTPRAPDYFTVGELAFGGFMAGASVSVLQCPITTIRIQQQVSARSGSATISSADVVRGLYRHEGVPGLYRAFPYESMASGVGRMVYFTTYEVTKQQLAAWFPNVDPTLQKIVAAASTSIVGWAAVFPVDLIKNKIQAEPIGQPKQFRSYWHCCQVTYRQGGLPAFWTGFSITILRSFFSSGISLPVFDTLKPALRAAVPTCASTEPPAAARGAAQQA